ncbi:DEAD (Asp-Glu-Ala-Asp) box polypeptide 59 [Actinomortierella wolfii]|nr:DEAD (Asp-Glu-Ala-Asp) box polypeptide 59 [Actinomortierella wolfii]
MHINILQSGCYKPTPVQMQAIPAGLSGQDVVITAPTGSGKTASYLIPTLVHAYGLAQVYTNRASRVTLDVSEGDESQESSSSEHMGPYVIILVPTHELAAQVEEQAKVFVKGLQHMRTANLSGSLPIKTQVYRLRQNIQIAVATPGRLIDIFFRYPEFSFSNVYSIVLDEVDVMYSLGFEQQVQRVLDIIPEPTGGRQTIVCSATFPKKTEKSIQRILRNPIRIRVGDPALGEEASASDENEDASGDSSNSGLMPSASVRQTVLWVENVSKKKKLFSILRDRKYFRPPILIFVESRLGAQLLAKAITVKCPSVKATFMHGESTPTERVAAISGFKDGSFDVMVATGLLARGLDLGVPLVINFDMAPTIEEYIHRIGRANIGMARHYAQQQHKDQGRRQIIGPKMDMAWAITFINHDHDRLLFEFANMLNKLPFGRITPMPPQLLQYVVHTPAKRSIAIKSSKSHDASDPPKTTLSKGVLAGASMGKNDKGGFDMMKPSNMPQGMKRKRRKRSSTLPAKKTKLKE